METESLLTKRLSTIGTMLIRELNRQLALKNIKFQDFRVSTVDGISCNRTLEKSIKLEIIFQTN